MLPRGAEHSRGADPGSRSPPAVAPASPRRWCTRRGGDDTLNPDWEPLDDVDPSDARAVVGAAASSSDESARLDRDADGSTHEGRRGRGRVAPASDADGLARREPREGRRRRSRVFHAPRPRRLAPGRQRYDPPPHSPSVRLWPLRRIRRGRVRAAAARVVALPALAFPPNTPIVRFPVARAMGPEAWAGTSKMGRRAGGRQWPARSGGRSRRALRDAAQLAVRHSWRTPRTLQTPLTVRRGARRRSRGRKPGRRARRRSRPSRAGGGGGAIERRRCALRASIDAIVHAAAGIAR